MPISSGANGWPVRFFRRPPQEIFAPKKKKIQVQPHQIQYFEENVPPPRPSPAPQASFATQTAPKPKPLPPPTPPPSPPPSPEPYKGCCGRTDPEGGCCGRPRGRCCWSREDYYKFSKYGYRRPAGKAGCCSKCCLLLLSLLLLGILAAALITLLLGLYYEDEATIRKLYFSGDHSYYSVIGKYQKCIDYTAPGVTFPPPGQTALLPDCATTTTTIGPPPKYFVTPYMVDPGRWVSAQPSLHNAWWNYVMALLMAVIARFAYN